MGRRTRIDAAALAPVLLFAAAFALRFPHFGDPAYDLDEQFYLFAGDRLLHGALPYVDIWDRKPIGLFLLYAGIRLLGGAGIWQYQIVATVFAGATAWTIARLARPTAGHAGAIAAGTAYLVWIETVCGGGGQAPVFYNLLVALAAERVLAARIAADEERFACEGRRAMLWVGLALQIKYTVVCEAVYFGLVLAWWSVRRLDKRAAWLHVCTLALIALAPTFAAGLAYAAMGQWQAFWFANFVSIFSRTQIDASAAHVRLGQIALQFLPLAVCWIASAFEQRRELRGDAPFLFGWMIAAVAGFASIGIFYVHYALPLFVPATIAAAPIFRRRPIGPVMAALLLLLPASQLGYPDLRTTIEHRRAVSRLAALIPGDVRDRCLQVFDGPPILYLETHACLASRFPFPDHLTSLRESRALGIDRRGEIDRLFASRPAAVVIGSYTNGTDRALDRLVRGKLAARYRLVGSVALDGLPIGVFVPR